LSTQFASIRRGQIKSCLVDYGFTSFFVFCFCFFTFNHRKVRSGDNIKKTEEKKNLGVREMKVLEVIFPVLFFYSFENQRKMECLSFVFSSFLQW
jgi:hypothetical protein